ncbi:PAS domain S-box protein [Paenibacillus zeisoli]|uniref:Circadian input-output histidine kinase CikA n=1 Tax=Paenibacillus zeisoli TaxID=2496267 RepID=A0A433X1V8_9BACL|nr:PAS domain S-box protein [Paenibacillus zeisoli]RUT28093.1 PAS domain S-box protein [Paenibacillus zeisoli]
MNELSIDLQQWIEHSYTEAPIGIALISIEGNWIQANPSFCNTLGYTEPELKRLSNKDITFPGDLKIDEEYMAKLLRAEGDKYQWEKRYFHKNGHVVWMSKQASLIRDDQNQPLYFIAHVIDISSKKNVEVKMHETECMYKLISENALDIISYMTPEGITEYCSPSIRDVLGYEPEEWIGRNNFHYYHPEDVAALKAKPFADHDVSTYRVRHKSGYYVWFETSTKIIRDDSGEIQRVLGIGRDITERKKFAESFAEAQQIALLGSWEWDIVTDKVSFSEQIYKIFNLKQQGAVPSNGFLQLLHSEDQQRFLELRSEALDGHTVSGEFRHLEPNGSVKHLHIRARVTFSNKGQPLKMYGTTQDISERKKVELTLQETIERYTSLKKYNHDAIVSLDLDGNILNMNAMAERITGYKVKEVAGLNISKFIGVKYRNRILLETTNHTSVERDINKIKHRDGHSTEVLTTIAPIIINKMTKGYYIIAKDITEQKKLLIAKEAAERTNKAKSEFLAMMSHEIRTPMNGVIGMTDLLLETTNLSEEQREYIQVISKSGSTLLAIINDILDFSKIESGRAVMISEPFNIRELVDETLDVFQLKAREKKLEVKTSISPSIPGMLIGDSNRLKQVLMNVIGNAIKFTEHGDVSITIQDLEKGFGSVLLQFTISDTGIGIPKDKLKYLFEPFSQLDNFMTRKSEGTGLGLAISKKIVEMMGGEIHAIQTDEPGATFVFTAYFQHEDIHETTHAEYTGKDEQDQQETLNILIAEDNEVNQMVLTRMLEKMGFQPSLVENGNEVLEALKQADYDIVFMDIQMPLMNGLDATREIKKVFPAGKWPYITAVTANALRGDQEICIAAGMDDYISKPIKMEDLARVIHRYRSQKTSNHL